MQAAKYKPIIRPPFRVVGQLGYDVNVQERLAGGLIPAGTSPSRLSRFWATLTVFVTTFFFFFCSCPTNRMYGMH